MWVLELSKQRERFVDKLHDFTISLLGQPQQGRTFSKFSGPPGQALASMCKDSSLQVGPVPLANSCVPVYTLAHARSPAEVHCHVSLLLGTTASWSVRSVCGLFTVTSPGPGTQLAPNKCGLF